MARPEILFPLFSELTRLPGVGPKGAQAMGGLGVERPRDLLFTLPQGVIDRRLKRSVLEVEPPAVATVEVRILSHDAPARKGRPHRVLVEDAGTRFTLVFFHARGAWLDRHLPVGETRIVSGRVELFDGHPQMAHPDHVLTRDEAAALASHEPVYPLAAGLTGRGLRKAVLGALDMAPDLPEWIDPHLRAQKGWPGWREALRLAHHPESAADLERAAPARARLAYDELLAHQLTLAISRQRERRRGGRASHGDGHLRARVLAALPFAPTGAQTRAAAEIAADMAAGTRMSRLLQGDVGAGKTLVATLALLQAVEAGGQGAMMAPTEILARQHLAGIAPLAAAAGVQVEILTGRDTGQARAAKLARIASGEAALVIGTHALFQPEVRFADLRLAVIDEQHRFGVAQRQELARKGPATDVLVMTATPIPRSLALAQYGDLDLSVLDEKPPGRLPVRTAVMPMDRLDEVVAHLARAIGEGRQAYWVCPLVEETETVDLTAAEARARHLQAALGAQMVGLVHGQMPGAAKDAVMARFAAGDLLVLVATTVIEVGVDVPNASIMVIERADSFGLAQLHQLRGRVGRGAAASTCLLLYQPPLSPSAERRLTLMRETEDGFRLAEEDMAMRGVGDVIGRAQSGLPRFRIADLEHQAGLMMLAQREARAALDTEFAPLTDRGRALRHLLWLMQRDEALRLLDVG
ncbi:ATP-dependent DNA helicase RecG [Mangrovicoccus algicola]|uniref:ATP-dependent DNA helicase RecG n=1 Tax=Mangrovicoccus algicola TaxID=2771008 RepID=A0A8J7CIY8_9RHOB|nr:ATP-dependent DNA helicase RecG [Mangrovicoccus algicola]MBE3637066.1 ATP-dependent DNA helicase RecG [Mangrovicoccus algicola]